MFSFVFTPKSKRQTDEITFKRYIGFNDRDDMIKELACLKKALENRNHIYVTKNLDMVFQDNIIQKVEEVIFKIDVLKIDLSIISQLSALSYISSDLNEKSLLHIIQSFIRNEQTSNKSIINNFIVKLISWGNLYCKTIESTFNIYPPCFIYIGEIKKHEFYFLEYINMLGWDVIYINSHNIDPLIKYSIKSSKSELLLGIYFGDISSSDIEDYVEPIKIMNKEKYLSIDEWIKKLKTINKEIFGEAFIGHDIKIEDYSLKILELKELMKSKYINLINIINGIEPPSLEECKLLSDNLDNMESFCKVIEDNIPNSGKIFKNIVLEFAKTCKEENILKNFSTKLMIWVLRHKEKLVYKNSAILFFGKIKTHEVYFLKLMLSLGVSVIYLSPDKRYLNLFQDSVGINVNEFVNSTEMNEYPREDTIKRQETITYKAAKEVEKFIREGNSGLFKPYQLNNKKMNSKILISTLEEILVIWDEPSQYRTGFINNENLVEIPNVFIKINGVHEELKKYWEMINKLKDCENCLLIKDHGFSVTEIPKQELLKATFLFNMDGSLNTEKVMKSEMYKNKLGYLNLELQDMILDKIGQLLNEDIFLVEKNEKFKNEILITIINLDDRFIKMLEKHKFGDKVPKLIIYNNNKENYTMQEAITIIFLVLIGFDIVCLSPTAYNNMELLIRNDLFQTFRLDTVAYELEIPEKFQVNKKSLLERIFKI